MTTIDDFEREAEERREKLEQEATKQLNKAYNNNSTKSKQTLKDGFFLKQVQRMQNYDDADDDDKKNERRFYEESASDVALKSSPDIFSMSLGWIVGLIMIAIVVVVIIPQLFSTIDDLNAAGTNVTGEWTDINYQGNVDSSIDDSFGVMKNFLYAAIGIGIILFVINKIKFIMD
jgi:hypothetical protein